MTNSGTIKISFTGTGYEVQNGGGAGTNNTFHFLKGLDERGLFKKISNGPYARSHWIEIERLPNFILYCEANGFKVGR